MIRKKVTVSWSGGKDCALALYRSMQDPALEVVSLHTTIGTETRRVGLHGVREALIEGQAQAIGLPLTKLYLPSSSSNIAYEEVIKAFYQQCRDENIFGVIFGDIFLEDLKAYREELLSPCSLEGIYPLWKEDTSKVIRSFIDQNFKSIICAADGRWFDKTMVGRMIDLEFLSILPDNVDPCGENGEFHSLVLDGPIFKKSLMVRRGEVVQQTYYFDALNNEGKKSTVTRPYWFLDLLPGDDTREEAR